MCAAQTGQEQLGAPVQVIVQSLILVSALCVLPLVWGCETLDAI